jgi:hypothetical protein
MRLIHSAPGALFVWLLMGLICMILGARLAELRNRSWWVGASLGLVLGVLGLAIVALLPSAGAAHVKPAVQPYRRPAPADKRPAAAQARLDEIAAAIDAEDYAKAFIPMDFEMFDADRRGDLETLKALLGLAQRIERARYQEPKVKATAQEFAQRAQETIATFIPEDVEGALA